MASFVYKGISKKKQEELLALHMASVHPQDPRGRPPIYHIDQSDSEERKEEKRERKKKWMKDREEEYKKELKSMDEKAELLDNLGNKFVFEKGIPVDVPESSSAFTRLMALVKSADMGRESYWAKADKQEPTQEPVQEKRKYKKHSEESGA